MRVSNKLNINQAIVEFAKSTEHPHFEGIYSVTEILKPIKMIKLERKYYDDLVIDICDIVPALFGSAFHKLVENSTTVGKAEVKLSYKNLRGTADYINGTTLEDYKTTSVNKVIHQDFEEHKKQTLMYAYMYLWQEGIKITKIKINYLLKDWSKVQASTRSDYPQSPIFVFSFEVNDSDYDSIGDFINNRLATLESESFDDCTEEERWNTGTKWAVYKKKGDKRALKVCSSKEEAESYGGGYIEERPGENLRCKYYCNVCKYCNQKGE